MPIHEYRCDRCGKVFEELIRSSFSEQAIVCRHCGSSEITRALSLFGFASKSHSGTTVASGHSCSGCHSHNCSQCH
ncbi:MAG TPA: zinc ribbon domain-containing protein [bacterium]|nr:zinc ribbon domain-containing protein [bacterium]